MKRYKKSDIRNAAGGLCEGERTVKSEGIVRWDGGDYYDEALKAVKGERVRIKFVGRCAFSSGPIEIYLLDSYCPGVFTEINGPIPQSGYPDMGPNKRL